MTHTYNPSTPEREKMEDQKFQVILGYFDASLCGPETLCQRKREERVGREEEGELQKYSCVSKSCWFFCKSCDAFVGKI